MLEQNLRLWRDKNIAEGRQEGRQEARKEAYQESVMVARRLLQRGLSLAEVTELTRLSPEEISKIPEENSTQG